MNFRSSSVKNIWFDARLRGTGAQVHNDLAFCLALAKRGGKLLYDPAVTVDHYPAPRFDMDQRHTFNPRAHEDAVFNQTLVLLEHFSPLRRIAFLLWTLLIGTKNYPGVLFALFGLPRLLRWRVTTRARWAALVSYMGKKDKV